MNMRTCTLTAVSLMMLSLSCQAQELNLLAGGMHESSSPYSSYAWELDYREGIGEHPPASE